MSDLCTEQDIKDRLSDDLVTLLADDDQGGTVSGTTESAAVSRCIAEASNLVIAEVGSVIDISGYTYADAPAIIRNAVADIATYYLCERRNQTIEGTSVAARYNRAFGTPERYYTDGVLGKIRARVIQLSVTNTSHRIPVVQNLRVNNRNPWNPVQEMPGSPSLYPPRKYPPRGGG